MTAIAPRIFKDLELDNGLEPSADLDVDGCLNQSSATARQLHLQTCRQVAEFPGLSLRRGGLIFHHSLNTVRTMALHLSPT